MTIIAEDLLLLLLDDDTGQMAAQSSADVVLGGAVLTELALLGCVEVTEKRGMWQSSKVRAVPGSAVDDPVLAAALALAASKERGAQDMVTRMGKNLRPQLIERLVAAGHLEAHEKLVLGLFRVTRWPAADPSREYDVRRRLDDVLVHGLTSDPRTSALIGLLHAVDQAHKVILSPDVPAREIKRRAKTVAEGDWAAKGVRDAIQASQAAVAAGVAAAVAVAAGGS